ncbi:MAG: hypothetical protein CL596_03940 [Alteromonas sp.]|nr:hypothetical protein [Alteromonas sp.]MAY21238.1 hypothetical protein [Flavobacteriaceae bacterium]|tara:strand:+ start:2670 stop:3149 length:480 start_codon:yes stop_codon:yes gene_type:complete
MNKIVIVLIAAALFFTGCKEQPKENTTIKNNEVEHTEHHTESNLVSNDWMHNIQLDNGAKWEANPETNQGVTKMKLAFAQNNPKDLKDYHELAETLNNDKNFVIKECTMKGPSHDNLHVWLLPLIDKIDALKEAKTLEEAQQIYKSIEQNVNAYDTYFE